MFVVVLIVAAFLFNKVYIFQTHPHFETVRQGNLSEMLIYGLPFAFVFTVKQSIFSFLTSSCTTFSMAFAKNITSLMRDIQNHNLVKRDAILSLNGRILSFTTSLVQFGVTRFFVGQDLCQLG